MFGTTPVLNRIAQTITVGDVFVPFIGAYNHSESGDVVREDWDSKISKETPFDQIGLVVKDGIPVGTLDYDDLHEKRSIWASMSKLSWASVVAADTSLIDAAKLFDAKSPYVFLVLKHNKLVGWMSYHHLLGIPFRACLFSMLLGIEQAMLDIALTNPVLAVSKLKPQRVKFLEGAVKKRNPKLAKPSFKELLDATLFSDKLKIVKACGKTSAALPALSDSLVKDIDEVRNSLAHSSDDSRLIKLLSKQKLHDFLSWLTKLEIEMTQFVLSSGRLED